jgi:hypothetical protein
MRCGGDPASAGIGDPVERRLQQRAQHRAQPRQSRRIRRRDGERGVGFVM